MTLTILTAIALVAAGYVIRWATEPPRHQRPMPPATARQIKRARKASRAHLQFSGEHASPANADFDSEQTR